VEAEPIVRYLHERQSGQSIVSILRSNVGQHHLQKWPGDAPYHRSRFEAAPGHIVKTIDMDPGQLLDHPVGGCLLESRIERPAHGTSSNAQGQRMPARDAVQALRDVGRDTILSEHGEGGRLGQRPQLHRPEVAAARDGLQPRRQRGLAARDEQRHVGRQLRHQLQPDPVIDETKELVGVDDKHYALAQGAEPANDFRWRISAAPDCDGQRSHETGGRRFHEIAVEPNHDCTSATRFNRDKTDQRRFAHASQAVQEEDGRAVLLEQAEQLSLFGSPSKKASCGAHPLAHFGSDHRLNLWMPP
jgi:hypothetical protein